MSLILEALNRSQQDRSAGEGTPGLETAHHATLEPEAPAWRSFLPWVALVLALLVIVWLLFRQPPVKNAEPTAQVLKKELVAPSVDLQKEPDLLRPEIPASASRPAPPEPTHRLKTAAAPASGSELKVESAPQTRELSMPESGRGRTSKSGADPAIAALYGTDSGAATTDAVPKSVRPSPSAADTAPAIQPKTAAVQAEPVAQPAMEQPIDLEAVLARTQQELEDSRLAEHPAPFLSALSQQTKNDIPSLMYSRHDYSANGQSSIVVNGKTVRAGGNVASGVKLDEILPDSIVLNHQGTQFRLRALNSWVNL